MEIKVTNMEVWLGVGACNALGNVKLPVRVALDVARLGNKLNEDAKSIEKARVSSREKYYHKDEKGNQTPNGAVRKEGQSEEDFNNEDSRLKKENQEAFQKEYDELMAVETTIKIDKIIRLPEMVASTCDKCHHNMDKPLLIEAQILMPLVKFIELPEAK